MQQNLFKKDLEQKKRKSKEEQGLIKYDSKTMSERVERLKFLGKVFPTGYSFASDFETFYIFEEAKMAFINGEFISTILLSQAFIERCFQRHFNSLGLNSIANKGLKHMIDYGNKHGTIHGFLLRKVDELRLKRNPFVHLKDFQHKYNISQRIYDEQRKTLKEPLAIMLEDAKQAIQLMYAIFITQLR